MLLHPVLLVKGKKTLEKKELSALKASLEHLSYAPEGMGYLTYNKNRRSHKSELVRQAISALVLTRCSMANDDAAVASNVKHTQRA